VLAEGLGCHAHQRRREDKLSPHSASPTNRSYLWHLWLGAIEVLSPGGLFIGGEASGMPILAPVLIWIRSLPQKDDSSVRCIKGLILPLGVGEA
jgi:hypothetical protein